MNEFKNSLFSILSKMQYAYHNLIDFAVPFPFSNLKKSLQMHRIGIFIRGTQVMSSKWEFKKIYLMIWYTF